MTIMAWLKARIPRANDVVTIEIPAGPDYLVAIDLDGDEASERTELRDVSESGRMDGGVSVPLEPMFLIIEYCDARGRASRRRITTRTLIRRGTAICISAVCHERNALRTFRLDRIQGVIDDDGVIHSTDDYLGDLIGEEIESIRHLTYQSIDKAPAPRPTASPYTLLRRQINPAIVLLTAAARSDDHLHPEEVDKIMQYTETEGAILLTEGQVADCPGIEGYERLGRLILRTRPTSEDLDEALREISKWSHDRITRLARCLFAVVQADGVIRDEETALVCEFLEFSDAQGLSLR